MRLPMHRELTPIAIVLVGCATGGPTAMDTDPTRDVPGVETTLEIEPALLVSGGTARLTLTISNVGDDEVRFRFAEDRQVGLMIHGDGALQHIDSHTVPLPIYLSLGTFDDWAHTIEWDGRFDDAGRRVALVPGQYQVQVGFRRAGEEYVNLSNAVPIEIAP